MIPLKKKQLKMNNKAVIKGTFLDEISHDIPHQNWSEKEWSQDFKYMKTLGINKVILIRCGYKNWITYPSKVLTLEEKAITPYTDLVEMFLRLSEAHEMDFYFGLYDSGKYWTSGAYEKEVSLNQKVIDEIWEQYGSSSAFRGWYLSQECNRNIGGIVDLYAGLGQYCKQVSGGLPVLISPYIDGVKNISQYTAQSHREQSISLEEHFKTWEVIFEGIQKSVDVVAFQDGHVDYDQLEDFIKVNKSLADKNGITSWINSETFDRDMPIKFLPIKWDKLRYKLETAAQAGITEAITFEFSHFMSPQSAYPQAGHLYHRYQEYLNQK
jgi:hypothetical protein